MRGSYRDPEARAQARKAWAEGVVPDMMRFEVVPVATLLARSSGLVALDVGANKGYWTKALLNYFPGQVAHVYLFEPSPENYRELMELADPLIFAADDHRLFTVHNVAVGAELGEATLYTNEDGSPLASLYKHELGGDAVGFGHIPLDKLISTRVITIDGFLREQHIDAVDVLKIDVEGHEFAVLQGAADSLQRGIINCILWEFGMHQVQSRVFFKDFYEMLSDHGYEIYSSQRGHLGLIPRYSHEYENFTSDFAFAARYRAAPPPAIVAEFDEAAYLAAHEDVRQAVEDGRARSGLQHWLRHGRLEKRALR